MNRFTRERGSPFSPLRWGLCCWHQCHACSSVQWNQSRGGTGHWLGGPAWPSWTCRPEMPSCLLAVLAGQPHCGKKLEECFTRPAQEEMEVLINMSISLELFSGTHMAMDLAPPLRPKPTQNKCCCLWAFWPEVATGSPQANWNPEMCYLWPAEHLKL